MRDAYLCLVAAAATLVRVRARVGDGHQPAQITHVDLVRVGRLEQPLPQELSRSVSDLTVALHLPETQTAVAAGTHQTRRDVTSCHMTISAD